MATYDLNQAKTQLGDYAKTRYGYDLNEGDYGQIGQSIGYAGGDINDDTLTSAFSEVDKRLRPAWESVNQNVPNGGTSSPVPPMTSLPAAPPPAAAPRDGSVPPSAPPPQAGAPAQDFAALLGPNAPTSVSPAQQAAQEALMRLLANAQTAQTISDPKLAPVSDAYRLQRQRGLERERRSLAERHAATGTRGGGGFNVDVNSALQGANRDTALFDANLVKDANDAQRQQLVQAIGMAQQAGDAQAERDLRQKLALVDASLRQQQINVGQQLGQSDLELRRLLGFGGLDLNRELGRGDLDLRNRTLSQQGALGRGDLGLRLLGTLLQNDQFNSSLGLNAAQMQALLNQNAIAQLLGGF